MIINWINSTAVRLGFGPPQWIVMVAILALICVGMFETGGVARPGNGAAALSRTERRVLISLMVVIAIGVIGFALRVLVG